MKAKIAITSFILFLVPLIAVSQDFHFSGFNPGYVFANPSSAANAVSPEAGLTYRNQWPGMPVTFVTYGVSLILPVERMNSGLGISVLNDIQGGGILTRTYASASYSYGIEIGNEWKASAGIGAACVFRKLDTEGLIFRSDILTGLGEPGFSNTYIDDFMNSYPDFTVGMTFSNSGSIMTGFSVSHITRPKESEAAISERLPVKYMAFFKGKTGMNGRYSITRGISVEPSVIFSLQGRNNEIVWGTQAVYNSVFSLGGWMRQDVNFNYDAVIISAGFYAGRYNLSYSYDVNLKKVNVLSAKMAAHEVTFLYRFEYNITGAVPCPAY